MLDINLQHLKRNRAGVIFQEVLRSDSIWLLSFVDPNGDYKSDVLSWLTENHCQHIPHAMFSLDLYEDDIGSLLSALIEAPTIRRLLSKNVIEDFEAESKAAFAALSRVDVVMPIQRMEGSPYSTQQMEADVDEAVRSAEHHADIRIANFWLSTINELEKQEHVIFLFDNIDNIKEKNINLLWSIMERVHLKIKGFRVVVVSRKEIKSPPTWDYSGSAQAFYL